MTEPQVTPTPSQTSVPPTAYTHAVNQDYAISMLMEIQKTLGKNEALLTQLSVDVSAVKAKVSKVEKVMYAAGVVLVICVGVGGWMLNTAKDFVFLAYKNSLEQQQKPAIAPPAPTAPIGKKP